MNLLICILCLSSLVSGLKYLPGVNFMEKSVNIWKMNPFQGSSDPGIGSNIFILTYNRGNECLKDGILLPDAVCSNYLPIQSTNYYEIAGRISSIEDYQVYAYKRTNFEKSINIDALTIPFFDVSLSTSKDFKFTGEFSTSQNSTIIIKHAICDGYKITMSDYIAPNKLAYIKLDPEFRQSVTDLSFDYDPINYIKWLLKYGSHYINELVNGAILTEVTYFTSTDYQILINEQMDIEAAAKESTWFHTSSKSGSVEESIQAYTFDKYSYGGQYYSIHGESPSYDNPNEWLDLVNKNPVPIEMSLSPIFDLFTSNWFPDDINITLKRLNLAKAMLDYCNEEFDYLTGGCYERKPPAPEETFTSEFFLTAHNGATPPLKMIPIEDSICYITHVSALYSSGESCRIYKAANEINDTTTYWYLQSSCGKDFSNKCGARCIRNYTKAVGDFSFSNDITVTGGTPYKQTLLNINEGLCYFTQLHSIGGGDNNGVKTYCQLNIENNNWIIDYFTFPVSTSSCIVSCIKWKENKIMPENLLFLDSNKGTPFPTKTLMPTETSICYLSKLGNVFMTGEECWLDIRNVPGQIGNYWVLQASSLQSLFICGVYCFPIIM